MSKKYWKLIAGSIIVIAFVIYKAVVLNITWTGINETEAGAWKEAVLPVDAIQVIEAESQAELLRASYCLVIPLIIVFIGLIVLGKKKGWFMPSKKGFIIGAVTSFLLQGLHRRALREREDGRGTSHVHRRDLDRDALSPAR